MLTPTSTTAKLISDPLTAGNQVFFDALNAKGGIDGKYKVKLVVKDNKYGSGDNTATATAYAQTKGRSRRSSRCSVPTRCTASCRTSRTTT